MTLQGIVRNYHELVVTRIFLGVTEATVNPAFVLIMSIWYQSAEQPLRLGSYYCTNGLATMFGGLIGYAVGHIRMDRLPKDAAAGQQSEVHGPGYITQYRQGAWDHKLTLKSSIWVYHPSSLKKPNIHIIHASHDCYPISR